MYKFASIQKVNFMPEDEVITPATETPEIVDIQIVEHSRIVTLQVTVPIWKR